MITYSENKLKFNIFLDYIFASKTDKISVLSSCNPNTWHSIEKYTTTIMKMAEEQNVHSIKGSLSGKS